MGTQVEEHRARRLWRALEPLHAVTYFAPEPKAACEEIGARGYWRGYFAQRAAPLGAVPAEVVEAVFYNFAPGLVRRAIPDVWSLARPEEFCALRLRAVDAALRRSLGEDAVRSPEMAEAAELARTAALSVSTAGRALAAAVAAQPWPQPPHLVLWHAQTLLREHRGDGHVAALVTAGLDPVETLVVFAAAREMDPHYLRERRGWSPGEWAAAIDGLAARGLVSGAAGTELTEAGRALHDEVEARTDAVADTAWTSLGDERAERLVRLAEPWVRAVLASEDFLPTNPMGMRPLAPGGAARHS
ncbi:MAG: hypothetical protein OJJ54_17465 [Pseudonocardia sp.]|nr:hypothetical protein [Pseudonocardia sp.]